MLRVLLEFGSQLLPVTLGMPAAFSLTPLLFPILKGSSEIGWMLIGRTYPFPPAHKKDFCPGEKVTITAPKAAWWAHCTRTAWGSLYKCVFPDLTPGDATSGGPGWSLGILTANEMGGSGHAVRDRGQVLVLLWAVVIHS